MRVVRLCLGAVGLTGILVGALLVLGTRDVVGIGVVLVGPVFLHDGIIGMAAIVLGVLGARYLPAQWRAPFLAALVTSAGLTIISYPLLTRPGALPDNPTIVPRDYLAGWLGALVVVWAAALVWALVSQRRADARLRGRPYRPRQPR